MPLQKIYHQMCDRLLLLLPVLFLMFSHGSQLHAAPIGERTMQRLTPSDGLAGETVYQVMTDRKGYKWIATTGGVNIYNGRYFMTMRILNDKGRMLEVVSLCELDNSHVYAATKEGLYELTPENHRFEHIVPDIKRPLTLLGQGDTLYIGSEQGLDILTDGQTKHINLGANHESLDNIVRHLVNDDKGNIWFLSRHDLYRYQPKTSHLDCYDLVAPMGGRQTLTRFAMSDSLCYIGTRSNGLYVYDLRQQTMRHIDGIGKIVTSVQRSADGLIAVATDGDGAWLLDAQTQQAVSHFTMTATGELQLPTNALYSFYHDTEGNNWIGTVRYGLVHSQHRGHLFQPYAIDGLTVTGMNVRSFLIHDHQTLLGLQDGLLLIDSQRHERRHYTAEQLGGHIVNNICYWKGHYYIGTFDGGIRLLDPRTLTVSPLSGHLSPLNKTTVGDIKVHPKDSSLWVGCSEGLFVIPAADAAGSVRQFTEQNSAITGGIIISITFDNDGNAWLCGQKGISLYSRTSHDIVKDAFPKDFFNGEPYMRGFLGHDGIIYMRTGPQLYYSTKGMKEYGEVPLPLSLTDKWCRAMVDDGRGHLWLATERGLLGMNYEGHGLVLLGEGEGLMGDQISELRIDREGRVWVATSEGLFSATVKDFRYFTTHTDYKVTLYNIRKGSDLINDGEMQLLAERNEIRLSWNFRSQPLQAEPLLLDYARQTGRLYEYCLDGGDWQSVDDGQPIDVRGLLMGTHQLTIRLAGISGTETTYKLVVMPSFWFFFELAVFLIAVVSLWLWWTLRKNTKVLVAERNEIEDALIESEELRVKSEEFAAALQESGSIDSLQKYQKVKVDEAECADIVKRMKEYLERERVFTNADLKMKDLADVLHLSAPKLSQVFNIYLKENYYEFINRYRLDEFKRLIDAGEYKRYTITALSEQCGFKKSNFFSTFRKVEGVTPAEYLKKHGVSV